MLREGRGIGVRDGAGRWVGSALALPLGRAALLDQHGAGRERCAPARHRHAAAAALRSKPCARPARVAGLDATELGRPVYLPLGFRDLYTVSRLRLDALAPLGSAAPIACTIRPFVAAELPGIVAFDRPRSGMQRSHVLAYLLQQAAEAAFVAEVEGGIAGYALGRPGRIAFQVGPVVADREDVAIALVSHALASLDGAAIIDVPDAHADLRAWLDRHGAVRQRGFTRMTARRAPRRASQSGSGFRPCRSRARLKHSTRSAR